MQFEFVHLLKLGEWFQDTQEPIAFEITDVNHGVTHIDTPYLRLYVKI